MKDSRHASTVGNFESGRDHADTSANETAGVADAERSRSANASADRADGAGSHAPDAGEASADPSGHAKGEEIEVTEEMIEAGVDAWYDSDREYDKPSEIVKRIFLAMCSR
jgi:hypothetical protein